MQIYIEPDNSLARAYLQYSDILERSTAYDAFFDAARIDDEQLERYQRILLIERCDSATIGPATRRLLKHPHVATLLKMYYYDSCEVQNRPMVCRRAFIPLDGSEVAVQPEVTPDDLAKVRCGLNFYHFQPIREAYEYAKTHADIPFSKRRYQYTFVGTVDYSSASSLAGQPITRHRKAIVDSLLSRTGPIYVATGRPLPRQEYLALLANTRVAPSPYGWGECCYRDYEAMLLGCHVQKPYNADARHFRDLHNLWPFTYGTPLLQDPDTDARAFLTALLG